MERPEPIKAAYEFAIAPEQTILLKGSAGLKLGGEHCIGDGEVTLRFLPVPRLIFHGKFQSVNASLREFKLSTDDVYSFSLNAKRIDGFLSSTKVDSEGFSLDWLSFDEPVCLGDMEARATVAVISHLFNFPDFHGGQHQSTAPAGCPVLVLTSDEWKITIQALPDGATRKRWERIKQEGGSFLTHVMRLERLDGAPFSGEEAQKCRHMLSCFLSFVKGGQCWPVCEVGLDISGAETWKSFAAPHLNDPPPSWFSTSRGRQAEALFPLFANNWHQSSAWVACLKHAVHWYTQANTKGRALNIDSAIIFIQAALERLAHHYVVVDRKMLSSAGFKSLKPTSEKLRMLFFCLGIPIEITKNTPKVLAVKPGWKDAPHALTEIRNSLVHPDSKSITSDCYFDAWKLGLWYLELSILGVCGYNETYLNRLTAKYSYEMEEVPWRIARKPNE